MAIITLAETKEFLGIASTETSYDDNINALLPEIADKVREICHKPFTVQMIRPYSTSRRSDRDNDLYILDGVDAAFVTSTGKVTARDSNFASAMIAAGDEIFIQGSYQNDGYYDVDSVSTSVLTIASTYSAGSRAFVNEATGANVYVAVVKWPLGIKSLVASMIQFDYQERGSWKESDAGGFGVYGYPRAMIKEFEEWYMRPAYGVYVS